MFGVKREVASQCCFCLNNEDLFSMLEPYDFEGRPEIYATIISECFQIQIRTGTDGIVKNMYLICKNCIYRLREATHFRFQIQIAYDRIQALYEEYILEEKSLKSSTASMYKNENPFFADSSEFYSEVGTPFEVTPTITVDENNPQNFGMEFSEKKNVFNVDCKTVKERKETPYKCEICDKFFTTKNILKQHSKIHNNIDFSCEYCFKTFPLKKYLNQHLKTHFQIRNCICDMCGKAFINKSDVRRHIMSHMGIKKEKCEICKKAFTRKGYLTRHMKIHSDIKDFICDICSKSFIYKKNLQTHIISHMGISGGECEVCKKKFRSKEELKRHSETHNARNIVCEFCDKTFTTRKYLHQHMKIHLNVRNYVCNACSRSFIQKEDLKRHILTHMEIKKVKCNYCNKSFRWEKGLKRHMKRHSEQSASPLHEIVNSESRDF